MVRQFWEQEEIQSPFFALTPDKQKYNNWYKEMHSHDQERCYIVRFFVDLALPDLSLTY